MNTKKTPRRKRLGGASLAAVGLGMAAVGQPSTPQHDRAAAAARSAFAWADFDGDGREDVAALEAEGRLVLLLNRGIEGLIERPELLPDGIAAGVRSASWADFDADGFPDLLVVTGDGEARLLRNEAASRLADVTSFAGLPLEGEVLEASWIAGTDDTPDLLFVGRTDAQLLVNEGDGTFTRHELPMSVGRPPGASRAAPGVLPAALAAPASSTAAAPTRSDSAPTSTAGSPFEGAGSAPPAAVERVPSEESGAATVGGATPLGPVRSITPSCADSLRDVEGGGCLVASSDPLDGALYPLGQELFITPTGRVGINTKDPDRRLELRDSQALFRMRSTNYTSGSVIEIQNDTPSPSLLGGFNFRDASGIAGQLLYHADDSIALYVGGVQRLRTHDDRTEVRDSLQVTDGTGKVPVQAHTGISNGGVLRLSAGALGGSSQETVTIYGRRSLLEGAEIVLRDLEGDANIVLDGQTTSGHGRISAGELDLTNGGGWNMVQFDVNQGATGTGQMVMLDQNLQPSIILDAAVGTSGSRITTDTLEIRGGSDLVEGFDVAGEAAEPGTVMVIDPDEPGHLRPSSEAWDTRVAGVVSGAGDVKPGLRLGQTGVLDGDTLIALTGRVYVRASAENGAIRPGDLLTSAALPGHAMRVHDTRRACGATLGKAMTGLDEGTGLVLVLVGLQ